MDVLIGLETAIKKNVASPKPDEWEKYEFAKKLPSSPSAEGNYELGLMLFIGIAYGLGVSQEEIEMYLSIEEAEFDFKLMAYEERNNIDPRFQTKVKLIRNYLSYEKIID